MDWKYVLTSYDGRINRAKFWAGVGVFFAGAVVATIVDNILGTTFEGMPYGFVYVLYSIASLYLIFAVYAKRWHDRGKSGWWTLIALVPFIGQIWILVELGMLEGDRGANQYGPDPLA